MQFPRKASLSPQQQLASRPVRQVDGQWSETGGTHRLTVPIEQKKWSFWLLRLPAGASKTFEFDVMGRFVWDLCDGKHSLQQIARQLAKKFGVSERQALVCTQSFLRTLIKKGLIGVSVKE